MPVGGPGAGHGWALKVGAHSLGTAAATSTSRRFLCGSLTSRIAAAHARVAVRCLPRLAPPSQAAACARLPAGLPCCGRWGARCSKPVCRAAWDKTRPWYAEIASAGGCTRQARGGVAGSKPPSWRGCRLAGGDSACPCQGCRTATPAMEGKPPPGVGGGDAPACSLSPICLLGRGCHSWTQ